MRTHWSEWILIVIGGLGVLLVMIGSVGAVVLAGHGRFMQGRIDLATLPDQNVAVGALKRNFPEDYREIENQIRYDQSRGEPMPAVAAEVDAMVTAALITKRPLAASASDEALVKLAKPQLAYFNYLRDRDVAMCAHYSTTGMTSEDKQRLRGTSGAQYDLAMSATMIDAAGEAADDGKTPSRHIMSAATGSAILAQLQKDGAAPALIAAIAAPNGLARAPLAMQCDGGIAIARAMNELPPNIVGNYYRALLSGG